MLISTGLFVNEEYGWGAKEHPLLPMKMKKTAWNGQMRSLYDSARDHAQAPDQRNKFEIIQRFSAKFETKNRK